MKLLTYNLWNSPIRRPERLEAACRELLRVDADLVALQEVAARVSTTDGRSVAEYLAERCGYAYHVTRLYPDDPDEGLGVLSKYPLRGGEAGWETQFAALRSCGLRVCCTIGGATLAITNVHLDYRGPAQREAELVAVTSWIESRSDPRSYEILCGDFNAAPESGVYRFLMGQQTLNGAASRTWHDVARYHAEKTGSTLRPTLDFWNNPRWWDAPTLEIPVRCDWILVQDVFDRGLAYPIVRNVEVVGTEPPPGSDVVPSDHYGVCAELDF